MIRWILAAATFVAFWRRSCAFRNHEPVRYPQGWFRCRRCGMTAIHIGEFLGMDPELDGYVNPERIAFLERGAKR